MAGLPQWDADPFWHKTPSSTKFTSAPSSTAMLMGAVTFVDWLPDLRTIAAIMA